MSTRTPRHAALVARTKSQTAFQDPLKGVNLDGPDDASDDSEDEATSRAGTEAVTDSESEVEKDRTVTGLEKKQGKGYGHTKDVVRVAPITPPQTPSSDPGPNEDNDGAINRNLTSKSTSNNRAESGMITPPPPSQVAKTKQNDGALGSPFKGNDQETGRGPTKSKGKKRAPPSVGSDNDVHEHDEDQNGSQQNESPPRKKFTSPTKKRKVVTPNGTRATPKSTPTKKSGPQVKTEPQDEFDPALDEMGPESEEEDVKPNVKGISPRKGNAGGKANVKAKTGTSQLSGGGSGGGGGNGGDKFITTPANRKAMMEEILRHVATATMDFKRVKQAAGMTGDGDEKKLTKYFTQTFKKHLLIAVESETFGRK